MSRSQTLSEFDESSAHTLALTSIVVLSTILHSRVIYVCCAALGSLLFLVSASSSLL
jgi:hypothetical protein